MLPTEKYYFEIAVLQSLVSLSGGLQMSRQKPDESNI